LAFFNNKPALENQISEFDISLTPFNRKEKYYFDFVISAKDDIALEEFFKISTPEPVRFKKVKSESEILSLFNKMVVLFYGKMYLSLPLFVTLFNEVV